MSIKRDARNKSRFRFNFKKEINGETIRRSKLLPEGYSKSQAQQYDIKESARIFNEYTNPDKNRVLISECVLIYLTRRCPELKNGYGVAKELERLAPFYEGRYLSELAAVGTEYRQAEVLRLAPASIKNKLSYLRAACRYAQKEHGVGDINLRLQVGMPTVKNARQRYLTRQQMLTICKMCTDRTARAVIRISFYSGMRISETILAGRHLRTIQSGEGFFLQDTKNGSMRIAAMHPKLRVLSKYFPLRWKKSWIQKLIRRAMDAAGFQEYVLHDIRHSTASALINAGVDLYTVGQVLGHKSLASTARYAHLDMRSKIDAINKIK